MLAVLKVILVASLLLGLGLLGMAIKVWSKKNGEFSGTCASNSPFLNEEGEACSLCGALPDQKCKSEDKNTQIQKKEEPEFSPFV